MNTQEALNTCQKDTGAEKQINHKRGKEADIHITASFFLTPEEKSDIEDMMSECREYESLLQTPFMEDEENEDVGIPCFFTGYDGQMPVSFLSMYNPGGGYGEIFGFVLPEYRRRGICNSMMKSLVTELEKAPDGALTDLYLVSDGRSADAQAVLSHWGLKPEYMEYLMKADTKQLSRITTKWDGTEEDSDVTVNLSFPEGDGFDGYCLMSDLKGEIGRCRLSSYTDGVYLYDFEIARGRRRQGLGKLFIRKLASYCEGFRPCSVCLQTCSVNEAACALYRSCGFRIIQQLSYYRIM